MATAPINRERQAHQDYGVRQGVTLGKVYKVIGLISSIVSVGFFIVSAWKVNPVAMAALHHLCLAINCYYLGYKLDKEKKCIL